MPSTLQKTKVTGSYVKIGVGPAVIIWNEHPSNVLRLAINTAKPDDGALLFHTVPPLTSVEHAQIPDGAAVYLRCDRDDKEMDVIWRLLSE